MPKSNTARVEALRAELEAVRRSIQALADDGSLERLADQDRERWTPVLDALSAAMEGGEPGSVRHALNAVTSALQEP